MLSRNWRDLEEGYEAAERLEWQAWVEGGSRVAETLFGSNDVLRDAEIELRRNGEAVDAEVDAAVAGARRSAVLWTSAVAGVLGVVWLVRLGFADNPLARIAASASEGLFASGVVLPVAAGLLVLGLVAASGAMLARCGGALMRAERSRRKYMLTADEVGRVIVNTPTVSVVNAWQALLTDGDGPEGVVPWRHPEAAGRLVGELVTFVPDMYYGMENVPVTGTSSVDLLIVGPSRVWALELGGCVGCRSAEGGERDRAESAVRPMAERQQRLDESVAALKALLRRKCPDVDMKDRVSGLVVDLESAWVAPWELGREHEVDQCWVCCYREIYDDGYRYGPQQWKLLGAISRNAAVLREIRGEEAIEAAEVAYAVVSSGIQRSLAQGTEP